MKSTLKRNRSIIIFIITVLCVLFSACRNDDTAKIEYIDVSGMQVESNATELNLQGKNITDISSLYSLENLELVDLRNNPINQTDIVAFIETNPNCQVLWSVQVYSQEFDNTAETISFNTSDTVNKSDIEDFINLLKNLKTIQLYNTNISSADYAELKNDFSQIDFDMTVIISGCEFNNDSSVIDLSNCTEEYDKSLLAELEYLNEINSIIFGDNAISNELKDELIEKYPNISFDWKTQLLNKDYSSAATEIDISGTEISDLEGFKSQLHYLTNLEYIDMCDCGLTNLQMEELIAEYPQIKFVWKVQVGSWEMRTDIKAFGTCYSEDFEGGSYIGGSGAWLEDKEATNLKYCKDLITLDIGHQHLLNDFSFLLELDNLKHLIVALSDFEDASLLTHMKDLEYLEIFMTNVSDLSPLLELNNLKYLNCSITPIPNVDYLVDMKQLEVLWLCNAENISRDEAARLEEALPNCYINTTAQGATRDGWRSYDNQGYIDMRESLNMFLAFDTEG